MATVANLASRLRTELGDLGKSFVYSAVADGVTNRFLVPYSPLDGLNLVVTLDGEDVSSAVEVEEITGYITFDAIPDAAAQIVVAGQYFKYFTNSEINQFVTDAAAQHTNGHADGLGRRMSLTSLPSVEEYPVVVYASTLALYVLATDASFDIDITAPDGVMIPRAERYRQLMDMVQSRKDQYRELCSMLGIGLYKIDVFTFRRVSKTTNRYVPVYLPMEVDDRSMPSRAIIPVPTYGSDPRADGVPTYDHILYQGDSYSVTLDFPFDVSGYEWRAHIAQQIGSPVVLASFTVAVDPLDNTKLNLSLTSAQTTSLPERCFWDIQATSSSDAAYEKTYMKGAVWTTPQVTV